MKLLRLNFSLELTLLILGALMLAICARGAGTPVNLTAQWTYTNQPPDVFKVYQTSNLGLPLTNWLVVATVPGVTTSGTNSWTTTNAFFSVIPGVYFWTVTASNFWGESIPGNTPSSPPPVGNVTNILAKPL